jgi:PIN domain nuclease of toxin-antitoxin system
MLVLDTCALIHDALRSGRLSADATRRIDDAAMRGDLGLCDISLWEVAMLAAHGRLRLSIDPLSFLSAAIDARRITVLPISSRIAVLSATLDLHGDPADRLIVATCLVHSATLVSTDGLIRRMPGLDVIG